MKIYSAPLQGYTSAIWRKFHNEIFGGIDRYYSPFLRIYHGEVPKKDISDIAPENNEGVNLAPQIIATTPAKAKLMIDAIIQLGYKHIDVNFGCPFPPIAYKHQGSGILQYPDEVKDLLETFQSYRNEVDFSFKCRLGFSSAEEFAVILPLFNEFNPTQLTIHPRIGKQQYKGELDMEAFDTIYQSTSIPLVFNGDILSIDDISRIEEKYPRLKAVMIGRGLLQNPGIAREYNGGKATTLKEYLKLSNLIYQHCKENYCGAAQILSHIKPLWEYAPATIDRQILKAIKKSGTLVKYEDAISLIR